MGSFYDQFDGYVIPDHFRNYDYQRFDPIRIWMVDITLTSGEVIQFYVKARTKHDALEKAKSYIYLAEITLKGEFRLLP